MNFQKMSKIENLPKMPILNSEKNFDFFFLKFLATENDMSFCKEMQNDVSFLRGNNSSSAHETTYRFCQKWQNVSFKIVSHRPGLIFDPFLSPLTRLMTQLKNGHSNTKLNGSKS